MSKTVLLQTIQFSISKLLKYQTLLFDQLIGPDQVLSLRTRVDLGAMAIKGTLHSPKLQHYWRLTIRLFSVICRTLVGGVLLFYREEVCVFSCPT